MLNNIYMSPKSLVAIILFLFVSFISNAQSLYMPRNVKMAFEKGTRAMDGNPGVHYWQNHSNYDINLTVAPPDRTIKGSEEIIYFNESPDTLKTIVFRLTMNYHKPEADRARGLQFPPNVDLIQLTSGIHIDHFEVNGEAKSWPAPGDLLTWQNVPLSEPLLPGDSVHFLVRWHYDIAPAYVNNQRALREGMVDSTTWCVAYFYPRVAVYDDYNGWDRLPFTDAQEFYNDFSNYMLKVNVPKNFIVWATGTLENPDDVLQPHYAQLFKKSLTSDRVIHIATPADLEQKNITQQNAINTWIWEATNVTDVALFISDHDNWDAASVAVDSSTGRRASMQAAYYDSSANFHQAVTLGRKALSWYSRNLPGISYPYPAMTVVEGFAAMEYPMMVNDGEHPAADWTGFQNVQNHEIAHSYFPFYMGTNESRYAFMDEGWAQTLSGWLDIAESGVAVENESLAKIVIQDTSQEGQVPVIEVNLQTDLPNLGHAYIKPLWAYLALKDLLGEPLFKKCLQEYMARWHGKHPIPWDFFNSFNNISGENLNWFWNSWFFSHGYDDLGVGKVENSNNGYAITIKNVGGFDIPFDLKINYADGGKEIIHKSPLVWKNNPDHTVVNVKTNRKISSFTIDNGVWMDANDKDNTWSN